VTYPVAKAQPPHRYLHISFNFRSGPVKTVEMEPAFNHATDWYRYAPNCWLVWTSGTTVSWYNFLKPNLGASDYLFVTEVGGQYAGWLPQGAWEWLQRARPEPLAPHG
jgi:hypothetical protein